MKQLLQHQNALQVWLVGRCMINIHDKLYMYFFFLKLSMIK